MNVPDIRGSQVSQPSGQMYLYNDCSSERLSYDEQELQKIFSLLHLGGILGENLWYLCISFGIQIPSARHHSCGTIAFFQACWRRIVSFLRTRGQFLYNLYDIPFKPGALPTRALWMKSRTSFSFIPLSSNITVGSWDFGKSLSGSIGIPFKSSEYVIFKWFSSSSFDTSSLPLFDSTKSFFCESVRIWVECSPSLTLFHYIIKPSSIKCFFHQTV